jgi:hypothetical protein
MALRRGTGFHLANALSYVINPLILPPIAFGIILWHFGAPPAEIVLVVLVALVFFTVLPLGYLIYLVQRGLAESIEVRRRTARFRPFLIGIGFYLVGLAVLSWAAETAQALLLALAALYPINTLIILLITLRWKISVHMIGLAGFISVLLYVSLLVSDALPPREGSLLRAATVLPLIALVPILMWARVRVEAHSVGQVVAGAAFGLLVPYLQLELIVAYFGLY